MTTGSNIYKYSIPPTATTSTGTVSGKGGGRPSGTITSPQPLSTADKHSGGANNGGVCGAYCSTRNGSPSLNGNGGGAAVGKPCAGCVGKADNKNPRGQRPNATDHNAGYECDRNHGIGRSNPAHTGCKTTTTTTTPPPPPVCIAPSTSVHGVCAPPKDCRGVIGGAANGTDCTPGGTCVSTTNTPCTPGTACLPTTSTPCTPGTVCSSGSTMTGGVCTPGAVCSSGSTMTGGVCTLGAVCSSGPTMTAGGTSCTPPVVCSNGAMIGPIMPGSIRPGCHLAGGGGGGGAQVPTTITIRAAVAPNVVPAAAAAGVMAAGTTPVPVTGVLTELAAATGAAPAAAEAWARTVIRASALPFTGSETGILAELAVVLLSLGTGLVAVARRQADSRS